MRSSENYTGSDYFSVGPYLRYDFLRIDKVYFAITGSVYYTNFSDLTSLENRITFMAAPRVVYKISGNVEVYMQFGAVSYTIDWDDFRDTSQFSIQGFSSHSFGMIFRFGSSQNVARTSVSPEENTDVWW